MQPHSHQQDHEILFVLKLNDPLGVPSRLPMAMVFAEAGKSLVGVTGRGPNNARSS
jgi:hypothetical protein